MGVGAGDEFGFVAVLCTDVCAMEYIAWRGQQSWEDPCLDQETLLELLKLAFIFFRTFVERNICLHGYLLYTFSNT